MRSCADFIDCAVAGTSGGSALIADPGELQ